MEKKLTFKVTENGKENSYEEVYSFERNDKTYMIYTDNTEDEEGNLCMYAAIYDVDEKKLIPIEDNKEWEFVQEMLEKLEND